MKLEFDNTSELPGIWRSSGVPDRIQVRYRETTPEMTWNVRVVDNGPQTRQPVAERMC
jgi:hypothetical protein